jgi:uncharacterized protein DUF4339
VNRTTDEWRCIEASGEQATLTTDELRAKLRAGGLSPTTLVWRAGMPGWVPSSRVPELGPEAKGPAPALPVGQHLTPPPAPAPKMTLLGVPPAPAGGAPAGSTQMRSKPPPPPRPVKRTSVPSPVAAGGARATAPSPAAAGGPRPAVGGPRPAVAAPSPSPPHVGESGPVTARSPSGEAGASAFRAAVEQGAGVPAASPVPGGVSSAVPAPGVGGGLGAAVGGGAGDVLSGGEFAAAKGSSGVNVSGLVERRSPALSEPPLSRTTTPQRTDRPSDDGRNGRGSTLMGLSPLTAEEAQQLGALVSEGVQASPSDRAGRMPTENPPIVVPTAEATSMPSMITRPAPFSIEASDVRLPPAPLAPDVSVPDSARPLGDFGVFEDGDEKRRGVRAWASMLRRWPGLPAGSKLVAAFLGGGLVTFGALTFFARLLGPAPAAPAPPAAPAHAGGVPAPSPPAPGVASAVAPPPPEVGQGVACAVGAPPVRLAPRVARDIPVELAAVPGAQAVALGFSVDGKAPRGLRVDLKSLATTVEPVPAPRRGPSSLLRVLPVANGAGPLRWIVDAERDGDAVGGARTVPVDPSFVVGLGAQGVLTASHANEGPALAWEATTTGADALRPMPAAGAGVWVAYRQAGRVWAGLLDGSGRPRGELRSLAESGQSGSPSWGQSGDEVAVSFAWREGEGGAWSMRVARGPKHGPLGASVPFTTPPGGPGGDVIAPALAGLGDGRWVAVWTEGPSGTRMVRAATLGPSGEVVGEALTASTPGVNAGQASVAVASGGKVLVTYLTAAGRGVYELWGASLACTPSALGSSSP